MQDKIDCNKINKIKEERITNSIYTGSTTSRAYVQSSSNPLEIFHYLCKSFTNFEHTFGSLTLVFKIFQETTNLLITILTIQETVEANDFDVLMMIMMIWWNDANALFKFKFKTMIQEYKTQHQDDH